MDIVFEWINPDNVVLGISTINGYTEDNENVKILTLGFLLFNINFISYEN